MVTAHYSIWWRVCALEYQRAGTGRLGKCWAHRPPPGQASVPDTVPSLANIPLPSGKQRAETLAGFLHSEHSLLRGATGDVYACRLAPEDGLQARAGWRRALWTGQIHLA